MSDKLDEFLLSACASGCNRNNEFSFPEPGVLSPTPAAASAHYFVDDLGWDNILDFEKFDDVVVGSSFCALAYVDEALKRDPYRKILILERGGMCFMEYILKEFT